MDVMYWAAFIGLGVLVVFALFALGPEQTLRRLDCAIRSVIKGNRRR